MPGNSQKLHPDSLRNSLHSLFTAAAKAQAKANSKGNGNGKHVSRRSNIASKRQSFASTLFNQDLTDLAEWHRYRSPHEQKRFLRSMETMFEHWSAMENADSSFAGELNVNRKAALPDIPEGEAAVFEGEFAVPFRLSFISFNHPVPK